MSKNKLTHFNNDGNAHMVDVGDKPLTRRVAVTSGKITMLESTLDLISTKSHKKGDVLQVARIAGIMAAKKTSDIIPLCHPVPLTHINIEFETISSTEIKCIVKCETCDRTGIEMEALLACSSSLLTIYDMCKAVDREMIISDIKLLEKLGGKSGHFKI